MKHIEGSNVTSASPVNVKAHFNNDIRRFVLPSLSFADLEAQLRNLFSVPDGTPVSVQYKDEEQDLVTMNTDHELQYAIGISGDLLRVVVRVSGEPTLVPTPGTAQAYPFRFGGGRGHWGGRGRFAPFAPFPSGVPEPAAAPGFVPAPAPFVPVGGDPFGGRFGGRHGRRFQFGAGSQPEDGGYGHGHGHCHKRRQDEESAKFVARHVKDVTFPDGAQLLPKTSFTKVWRIRNEGIEWPEGSRLMFISKHKGDIMGGPEFVPIEGKVAPGSEVDVSVNLVAPEEPGHYEGFWRLCTADGKKFGQRLWVSIQVLGSSSSSADENLNAPKDDQLDGKVKQLAAMGFDFPARKVERLLRKFGGDINAVAEALVRKSAKKSCKRH